MRREIPCSAEGLAWAGAADALGSPQGGHSAVFGSCLFGFRGVSLLKLLLLGDLGPVGIPLGMCVVFCPGFVLARQKLGVRR